MAFIRYKNSTLLVLLFLAAGCSYEPTIDLAAQASSKKDDGGGQAGTPAARPELTAADLGEKKEARAFFADQKYAVFTEDISKDDLVKFVDGCYSAGAPTVDFAGIEKLLGKQVSSWLVITLPDDAAKRAKVIEVFNELYSKYMFQDSPAEDTGQKTLDIGLD